MHRFETNRHRRHEWRSGLRCATELLAAFNGASPQSYDPRNSGRLLLSLLLIACSPQTSRSLPFLRADRDSCGCLCRRLSYREAIVFPPAPPSMSSPRIATCDTRTTLKPMHSRYQEEPRRLDRPSFFLSIRRLAARKVREDCLLGTSD